MSHLKHLSMRVPWRDRPWDERVCDHPLDNSSCILLANIGRKRDDAYEIANAGVPFAQLDSGQLPCLSERATFMSSTGYRVTKTHPYSMNKVLKGHLQPTDVVMPGFAFEAVPFRWLSRETFTSEIWSEWNADYDPGAEDKVDSVLSFKPGWIMDGANQQAVIRQFFEPVVPGESLVFLYLKHSPLQEESTRRLLVGAARVLDCQSPGMWTHSGTPPFESSMWETALVHSLRPAMEDGILLPYQQLIPLLEEGQDVSAALAWAPQDADVEFSYVTEHVSDDTAIEALRSLQSAAEAMRALGLIVPAKATSWLEDQLERLWQLRGSTPGLGSVLRYLGVEGGHRVARALLGSLAESAGPWPVLEAGFLNPTAWPSEVAGAIPKSVGLIWGQLDLDSRDALRLLSSMDIGTEQVRMLMEGWTSIELGIADLVENPYNASICTYRNPLHITFTTVDRAVFPATHVTWPSALPQRSRMDDLRHVHRVEALLVDVLHQCAEEGDTLAPQSDLISRANDITLTRPCEISEPLLRAYGLDAESLSTGTTWTPIVDALLADGSPALKLEDLALVKDTIVDAMSARRDARRFQPGFDPRVVIDASLPHVDKVDADEELARVEKSAGLAEMYSSRLSVLVGPAGTGKTTLLRALADLPDVRAKGVLMLAPTGKARVQLQTKGGHNAQTLASFLIKKGGYDPDTGEYSAVDPAYKVDVGLVVIDEASMLTEEMLAATISALGSVQRLVLVGDPRQLPPIGAGRPFLDVVEWLRPDSFAGDKQVGPGYVELRVFRRQGGMDRDDLALAAWFGGGALPPGADAIWERLRAGVPMATLEHVTWSKEGVIASLETVLERELAMDPSQERENAFKLTYGGTLTDDGKYVNWETGEEGAGFRCEDWQILSPTRSRTFGTVELNRHIKRTLRTIDLQSAQRHWGWRNPQPLGPELIVLGDKVMQTRNDSRAKAWPKGAGIDYVANGEIGVVVGRASKSGNLPAQVEFSSQVGVTYSYWPSPTDDPKLELAWAVTVHKSQGSEFRTTILVLPSRVAVSRELLYTALTRQTRKVVILHDGTVDDLALLTGPSRSETARRMTDLFRDPLPRKVVVGEQTHRFDGNLIHVATNNVMVRSKNEVIVADILESVAPGRWRYERQVTGADGSYKLPDFTIDTAAGEQVFWEHLGMLNNPRYARDWESKKRWYAANGILPGMNEDGTLIMPADKRGGPNGTLIWTDDLGGVNQPEWQRLAEEVIGKPISAGPARKAAKKAARPKP